MKENGPMSRRQLCEAFGFEKHTRHYIIYDKTTRKDSRHCQIEEYEKRTTIYDNLLKLQNQKRVEKFSRNKGKRGRPEIYWKITNKKGK